MTRDPRTHSNQDPRTHLPRPTQDPRTPGPTRARTHSPRPSQDHLHSRHSDEQALERSARAGSWREEAEGDDRAPQEQPVPVLSSRPDCDIRALVPAAVRSFRAALSVPGQITVSVMKDDTTDGGLKLQFSDRHKLLWLTAWQGWQSGISGSSPGPLEARPEAQRPPVSPRLSHWG